MKPAPTALVRRHDTHRLIPSKYREDGASVLADLTDDDDDLAALFELDHASNERLLAEHDRAIGIGTGELVFGVPYYRTINAAFCHPHPEGARFSSPERGAWYAAFERATAQAEVVFHRSLWLAEIARFEDEVTYDDYLADVSAELHDLHEPRFANVLSATSYVASQKLAAELLATGSLGVVYPSVRHRGGTCLALFRPMLVQHVRRDKTLRFTWSGSVTPKIRVLSAK